MLIVAPPIHNSKPGCAAVTPAAHPGRPWLLLPDSIWHPAPSDTRCQQNVIRFVTHTHKMLTKLIKEKFVLLIIFNKLRAHRQQVKPERASSILTDERMRMRLGNVSNSWRLNQSCRAGVPLLLPGVCVGEVMGSHPERAQGR